ncbi:MAG: hypothetical protein NZ519_04940 [Bacteroidia bacterium]|nr:hypothetical protein [Bacteroidia bacterium]MDW8301099.1 hypothetical protein [Bacteroidia bacterium]
MGVSLRSCPQGRRATGYVRNAPTLASARGTPKKIKIKSSFRPNICNSLLCFGIIFLNLPLNYEKIAFPAFTS